MLPVEQKMRIVLAILAGETTIARAARQHEVTEQSIANWKRQFLRGAQAGLAAVGTGGGRSADRAQLERKVKSLETALSEAAVQAQVWKTSVRRLRALADLEAIRRDAAMPVSRFCALIGIPRRSYHRLLAAHRSGEEVVRVPARAVRAGTIEAAAARYAANQPGWGHRRIHALMAADGFDASASTVERALRRQGLLQPANHS